MLKMRIGIMTLVLLTFSLSQSSAVKPILSLESLRNLATHIVVGKVRKVYQREQVSPNLIRIDYLAEVLVRDVEKGKDAHKGELIYVRYWKNKRIDAIEISPGPIGHREIPSEGEEVRVYLAKNSRDGYTLTNDDGGFNVIGPNGFERLTK